MSSIRTQHPAGEVVTIRQLRRFRCDYSGLFAAAIWKLSVLMRSDVESLDDVGDYRFALAPFFFGLIAFFGLLNKDTAVIFAGFGLSTV